MARSKKLKENGKTIYPVTILDAVVDSNTSTPVTKTRLRYSRASAHGRYYKFMTLKRGPEKGIVRFGVESPLMGYADYMVNWTYDTNTEKGMNPYCLFSTNAQMYNRVKLVRTGNDTFDVYFESNAGNDYPAFVFMGEGGTTDSSSITNYIVSTVSAIPEDVYKESTYVGNICFGTVTGTLAGTADSSKALVPRTETDINAEVFKSPGVYVAPISMIDVDTIGFAETVELKGYGIVMTVGQSGTGVRYQYIFVQEETGSYLYRRMLDPISLEQEAFYPVLPDIATSNKAGLVKSGGDISVDSLGNTSVKRNSFNNAGDDAINIDNYPQADYGVIPIWLNTAEADGNPPGREGIILQAKYKSSLGETTQSYVDCLTQLYIGSEGVKFRTIIDYDAANPFDGTAWESPTPEYTVIPAYVYQAAGYIDLTGVTFNGLDASKPIYVQDTYGGNSGLIPLSVTKSADRMYITFTYYDSDYSAPVVAHKTLLPSDFGKQVTLSFKEFK